MAASVWRASAALARLLPGPHAAVTVTLRVASGVPAGQLTNVASVYSPDSAANVPAVVSETTTITTAAKLRVTKAALNNPAVAGGQQSYQVVVYNDGPSDALAVRITDTLPAATTYGGGAAECAAMGQLVTCDLGVLPAGASHGLLLNVTVDPQRRRNDDYECCDGYQPYRARFRHRIGGDHGAPAAGWRRRPCRR